MQPNDGAEWRPIPGFDGRYFVSSAGEVRSGRGPLKASRDGSGYLRVPLRHGGGRLEPMRVHVAVLLAFTGPMPEGCQRRHLDGDQLNNSLANLSYGTPSENCQDLVKHGTHVQARKTHCPSGHPYSGSNLYVRPNGDRACRTCRRTQRAA